MLLRLIAITLLCSSGTSLAATDLWELRFKSLSYRNTPWSEVMVDLTARLAVAAPDFKVEVELPENLPPLRCDLRNARLPDALDALSLAGGLRWTLREGVILIEPGKANPRARMRRLTDTIAIRQSLNQIQLHKLIARDEERVELFSRVLLPAHGYVIHPACKGSMSSEQARSSSLVLVDLILKNSGLTAQVIDRHNVLIVPEEHAIPWMPKLLAPLPFDDKDQSKKIQDACKQWLLVKPDRLFEAVELGERDTGPETARNAMDRKLATIGELLARCDAVQTDTNMILHLAFEGPAPLREPLMKGFQRNLEAYQPELRGLLGRYIRGFKMQRSKSAGYPPATAENLISHYPLVDGLKQALRDDAIQDSDRVASNWTGWVRQLSPGSDEAQEIYQVVAGKRHGLSYTMPRRSRRILWETTFINGKMAEQSVPVPWTGRVEASEDDGVKRRLVFDDMNVLRLVDIEADGIRSIQFQTLPQVHHRRSWEGNALRSADIRRINEEKE